MIEENKKRSKACVGVMIFKNDKVLLGKRKGSHGAGEYSFPGGHMEFGESFSDCVIRETLEETGVEIKNIKFQCVSNIFRHENRQDILVSFIAEWKNGEPKIMEPEKCDEWKWYDLDNLPKPLFYPTELLIDSYKTGKNYYDKE